MNTQARCHPEFYFRLGSTRHSAVCSLVLMAATSAMPMCTLSVAQAQSAARAGLAGRSQASAVPATSGVSKLPTQSAVSGLSPAALRAADALFAQTLKSAGRFALPGAAQSPGRGTSKQMTSAQAGYALRATVLQWSAGTRGVFGSESTGRGKGGGRGLASGAQAVVQVQVVDPRTQSVVATVRGTSATRYATALSSPAYTIKTPGNGRGGYSARTRNAASDATQGITSLPPMPTGTDSSDGNTLPQNTGGYTLPQGTGASQMPYMGANAQTGSQMPGQSAGGSYAGMSGAGSAQVGGALPGAGDSQALQQAFMDALRQILALMDRMLTMRGSSGSGMSGGLNNGGSSFASPPSSFSQPGGTLPVPGSQPYDSMPGSGVPAGGSGGTQGLPAYNSAPASAQGGAGADVQLQTFPAQAQDGQPVGVRVRVLDSRGLPLAHKRVMLMVEHQTRTVLTDAQGFARTELPLARSAGRATLTYKATVQGSKSNIRYTRTGSIEFAPPASR